MFTQVVVVATGSNKGDNWYRELLEKLKKSLKEVDLYIVKWKSKANNIFLRLEWNNWQDRSSMVNTSFVRKGTMTFSIVAKDKKMRKALRKWAKIQKFGKLTKVAELKKKSDEIY